MSPQLLELLFLAGIAFILINKLISMLGTTNPNDATSGKSFFGEKNQIKDVTPLYSNDENNKIKPKNLANAEKIRAQEFLVTEKQEELINAIADIAQKLPNFKVANFIRNSKSAFQMILEALASNNSDLSELVDKRYIDKIKELAYGSFIGNVDNLEAKISEAYSFGNSLFIKVLFSGQNITQNCQYLQEEWTFSKNMLQNSPIWYLNNIDKL